MILSGYFPCLVESVYMECEVDQELWDKLSREEKAEYLADHLTANLDVDPPSENSFHLDSLEADDSTLLYGVGE